MGQTTVPSRPSTGKPCSLVLAQNVLSRVYNMHSLEDAIGGAAAPTPYSRDATCCRCKLSILKWNRPPQEEIDFQASQPRDRRNSHRPVTLQYSKQSTTCKTTSAPATDDTQEDTSKKVLSLEDRIDEILDSFLGNNNP
jgi:hypothetical protein